ncbi:hypothetical protein D3C87_1166800 [compost metagenome]
MTFMMSVYAVKRNYEKKADLKAPKEITAAIRKLQAAKPTPGSVTMLAQLDLIEFAAANQWDKFTAKVDAVMEDSNFPRKDQFVVTAANDVVTAAPAKYYPVAEKWVNQLQKTAGDFTNIQLTDLRKRILKKQGKTAEAEAMAAKAMELRKEAGKKGQMTPPIMND